ncbi:hypothetical protein [Bradyrhizobium japonicum]|uniref:hypothetical protein n=1 Tax=Bradyrhizobium japonicum TaxID=375 RepID=UPI001BA70E36|nr:hypothetical protein [Bradyrhizobium japonicum]
MRERIEACAADKCRVAEFEGTPPGIIPASTLSPGNFIRQRLRWGTSRNTCGKQIKSALPPTGDLSKTSYTCRDGPHPDSCSAASFGRIIDAVSSFAVME